MSENAVVRARIDARTKRESAAALKKIGLTVADAFRLLLVRVAAEKALPFEPLNPNAETVAAMKAAPRGQLVKVGKPGKLLRSLNAGDSLHYTNRFQRDYKREQSGRHGKQLDALLM